MDVETQYFAFQLPNGFVERPAGACWSAVHEADRLEITVASVMVDEEAGVDEMLRELAEMRLEVLRRNDGADHTRPLDYADRGDLRIASFLSVGREPMVSFCASVTHRRAVMGQRCVVTLCLYQYRELGADPPVAEALERVGRSIVDTLQPLPRRHALERAEAQGNRVDPTNLYPYLVPTGYLERRPPTARAPKAFGHGLFVALAGIISSSSRKETWRERPASNG
jgi:hypothetical protein